MCSLTTVFDNMLSAFFDNIVQSLTIKDSLWQCSAVFDNIFMLSLTIQYSLWQCSAVTAVFDDVVLSLTI